jgi:hypothetical protein
VGKSIVAFMVAQLVEKVIGKAIVVAVLQNAISCTPNCEESL